MKAADDMCDPVATFPDNLTIPEPVAHWLLHHIGNALIPFTPGADEFTEAEALRGMQKKSHLRLRSLMQMVHANRAR